MRRLWKRKCLWCRNWFDPNLRLGNRQKSCGGNICKRKQNLLGQKRWKAKNQKACLEARRDWQKNNPDFWRNYRKKNPKYTKRNRNQSRIRGRLLKLGLQRKLDILEVTEKTMEYWNLPRFAKQTQSLIPLLSAYTGPHEPTLRPMESQAP